MFVPGFIPHIDRVSAANAGHASPYTEEKYGGYGQLLETLLKEPGEDWEKFVVLEGEFPSAEQLAKVSALCLSSARRAL